MSVSEFPQGRIASRASDYMRLKLDPSVVHQWEDGQRSKNVDSPGTYEWWYADCQCADGTVIVLTFHIKPYQSPDVKLSPVVKLRVTLPDGKDTSTFYHGKASEYSASKTGCDIKFGSAIFKGDLHTYHVEASADNLAISLDLEGVVRPWRPLSGVFEFGPMNPADGYIGWVVPVPYGKAKGHYVLNGKKVEFSGTGYHDHNYGESALMPFVDHWYWARGTCGSYTVICANIFAAEKYNRDPIMCYLLTKDGQVLADNPDRATFMSEDEFKDEKSGKTVANLVTYTYHQDDEQVIVTFKRERTILWEEVGKTGWYMRFSGQVSIRVYVGDELKDQAEGNGIWELMAP